MQVHAQGRIQISSLSTLPSQMSLYSRYEALDVEGQLMGDMDGDPPEVFLESERSTRDIATTSTREKRRDIVVGNSLLRGTEGPLCWKDPLIGKSSACLRPGLRTSVGNFLVWYHPWTITCYCSYSRVAMRSQHVVWG